MVGSLLLHASFYSNIQIFFIQRLLRRRRIFLLNEIIAKDETFVHLLLKHIKIALFSSEKRKYITSRDYKIYQIIVNLSKMVKTLIFFLFRNYRTNLTEYFTEYFVSYIVF